LVVALVQGCGNDDEGAPAPTATATVPAPTATATAEPSATETSLPTATETAPPTATETAEPTATETAEPTATETAEPTPTPTEDFGEEPPEIVIDSALPSDIEGGAPSASLQKAAEFAWQEFIALNWPAAAGTRDTPDTESKFGDPSTTDALVWETYRHKVEIYPGVGDPPGFDPEAEDFGYSAVPPQYNYAIEVPPCEGQNPADQVPWVNVDEISQIGLASMFAGSSPSEEEGNTAPQLIRFLAKSNRAQYVYVADPATSYFDHPSSSDCPTSPEVPFCAALNNFTAVANGNGTPSQLPGPVLDLPDGTIEIKAAFRPLNESEANSGQFYRTVVRYYEPEGDGEDPTACYREAVWGLVGLHIIHKTPTAPQFIYATFEQAANILLPNGEPVEDTVGNVVSPPPSPGSTTPGLAYEDGNPPSLSIVGTDFCADIENRLFYQEASFFGPISDGPICVNTRDRSIPETIISVNEAAHEAIQTYLLENEIAASPWLHYKLVNVQWKPFDISEVDEQNDATFHLANSVIETDYTLQNFSGRIASNGAPTDLPANFDDFDAARTTFQNILAFDEAGNLTSTYNMGGCMGCHGNAQLAGSDFSFILLGGRVAQPEAPTVTEPGTSNPYPQLTVPESGD
jgi:hypothetical protein